jgi:hypothetical protein
MWALLPDGFRRALAWITAGLIASIAIFAAGKRNARQQADLDASEAYAKTRRAIDNEAAHLGDDPAVMRDWLRERGKQ